MLAESRRLTEAAHELIPRLPVNDRMRAYFEELHDLARTVAMLDPEEAKALLAGNGKVRIDVGCVGFVTHGLLIVVVQRGAAKQDSFESDSKLIKAGTLGTVGDVMSGDVMGMRGVGVFGV